MNILLYLLLIHFLADYALQPYKLIQFKKRTYWGVLLHCLIHLLTLIVILFPILSPKVWIGIAIIFITHNIIDQTKVVLDKKHPDWRLQLYFLDQISHLIIVTLIAFWIGNIAPNLPQWLSFYTDQTVIIYVLILALVTFFYDVTRYFIRTRKTPMPYKRDYRMILRNIFIVSVAFGVYWMAY